MELAVAFLYSGKSCGHGTVSDASDHSGHDHQPEVFCHDRRTDADGYGGCNAVHG